MPLPAQSLPPNGRTSYLISQLEGEQLTIPGSKGVFRILASAEQTGGKISVFQSGAVLSDAPGFHYHNEAHDVFLVTQGFLKLYNGDRCQILGPGDFAYVPPKIIHNPELLGPHTETFGLVAPGDWVDFFRYVGEPFDGLLIPEHDNRDLKSHIIPKMMAAKQDFDVHFVRDYQPPALTEWEEPDGKLPGELQPYYLKANTGPRWLAGGVMSRPFVTTKQSGGKFAISSIESSSAYGFSLFSSRYISFPEVDHCLWVQDGTIRVNLAGEGDDEWTAVRPGETLMIAAGQAFKLEFASKYVRVWSFTDGRGIEEVIQLCAGKEFESFVLPDKAPELGDSVLQTACAESGAHLQ
ncbi:RmlC-like cupin domain-containing protein [Xylariaceae sp. FL0804]|nr:RmlC-like cupin domain-containing protein [Xylariaceae sp. FL0804]